MTESPFLVIRNPVYLIESRGHAHLTEGLPEFFQQVHSVCPEEIREKYYNNLWLRKLPGDEPTPQAARYMNQKMDLLLVKPDDYVDNRFSTSALLFKSDLPRDDVGKPLVQGIWSGNRSVVVKLEDRLFRLKGVALDPEKPKVIGKGKGRYIWGGQPLESVEYEREMSDKFNLVLRNEGIDPVMECRGYWDYRRTARGDYLGASIVEVRGDTRLDELMWFLEGLFIEKVPFLDELNKDVLSEKIRTFYSRIGHQVGVLKLLMDESNQSWSSDRNQSNAHIGNIVLYKDHDKIRLGFADFDASCDSREFNEEKLKEVQKRERGTIIRSTFINPPQSIKDIFGLRGFHGKLRGKFMSGFFYSSFPHYKERKIKDLRQGIPFSDFEEIVETLRSVKEE